MATNKKASKKKASKKKASKKKASKKVVAKVSSKPPAKLNAKMSKKVTDFIIMKTNISAATKQLKEMKSAAFEVENELMLELNKMEQLGVSVKAGSIEFKESDVFNAKDWKKIEAHILKTKDFGLLQRRLSSALLKELWDDGKKIKGVEHMVKKSLKVKAAKK